jgi:molecular chaperone DnaK
MSKKKVCGIDLGTGFSAVAIIDETGKQKVIENAEGRKTTPSVVYLKDGERKIGDSAKRGMVMNPKNTVSFIKRFMGAEWNDADVQKMLSMVTYEVINKNGKPYVKIDDKEYSPVEISSMILSAMKKTAEDYYGEEVKDAVITCPAWFNDAQRQATKLAGETIGLNVLRIINEPTAAILASDIKIEGDNSKIILVNDLGCGTEDVSICEVSDGMVEVLASYGDVFLGGQNYDNALADYICNEFKKEKGIDLKKDQMAWARIIEAAEKAKCELSSTTSTEVNLPYITVADGVPQMLVQTITRAKFEQITKDLTDKVVECAREALKKAGKNKSDINEILLVGGSSRMPSVQEALTKEFGAPLNKTANFDEAVALGAVKQAKSIANPEEGDTVLLDVTPISLGIETMGEVMTTIIPANTTIPTEKKQIFSTAVDNQPGVQIKVLQGERPMANDNKMVGMFNLDGIAPAPRGVPQIEVSFNIDANGILTVSAKDLGTGKDQSITINNSNSLTEEEIKRMKEDAEKYAEEDKKKKEQIEKINECETYNYSVETTLRDDKYSSKFTEDEKKNIEEKKQKLDEALKDRSNIDAIIDAKNELEKVFRPVISKIYEDIAKENGANNQGQAGADMFNQFTGNTGGNPFADGMKDMFNGGTNK